MKTLYQCEICERTSEGEEVIRTCEAQGDGHDYSVGTEVEFKSSKNDEWYPGTVAEIKFSSGSHHPSYTMGVSDETAVTLGMKTARRIGPYSKNDIRIAA